MAGGGARAAGRLVIQIPGVLVIRPGILHANDLRAEDEEQGAEAAEAIEEPVVPPRGTHAA